MNALVACVKWLTILQLLLSLSKVFAYRDVGTRGARGAMPPTFHKLCRSAPFEAQDGHGNVPLLALAPPLFRRFLPPCLPREEL